MKMNLKLKLFSLFLLVSSLVFISSIEAPITDKQKYVELVYNTPVCTNCEQIYKLTKITGMNETFNVIIKDTAREYSVISLADKLDEKNKTAKVEKINDVLERQGNNFLSNLTLYYNSTELYSYTEYSYKNCPILPNSSLSYSSSCYVGETITINRTSWIKTDVTTFKEMFGKLKNNESIQIKFTGSLKTREAVDLVISFGGYTYDEYAWWNNSGYTYPAGLMYYFQFNNDSNYMTNATDFVNFQKEAIGNGLDGSEWHDAVNSSFNQSIRLFGTGASGDGFQTSFKMPMGNFSAQIIMRHNSTNTETEEYFATYGGGFTGFMGGVGTDNYIYGWLGGTGPNAFPDCKSDASISLGIWYRVTYTWNGTTLVCYVNSTRQSNDGQMGSSTRSTETKNLFIGDLQAGEGSYHWDGDIDEVRIWNITLNSTQIEEYWAKELGNPPAPADTPPQTKLMAPPTANRTLNRTPEFIFNVTDESSLLNCSLYLNNTPYGTNFTTLKDTKTIIVPNATLNYGNYTWYVNCSDTAYNNMSENRGIEILRHEVNISNPYFNDSFLSTGETTLLTVSVSSPTGIIDKVWTTLKYPNGTSVNYTMRNTSFDLCYQEFANVSTTCGGLDTGYYNLSYGDPIDPAIDGSWSTGTVVGTQNTVFNYNYSIPPLTQSFIWQTGDWCGTRNLTDDTCYTYGKTDKLMLRTDITRFNWVVRWECYNGSWVVLNSSSFTTCGQNGKIYEEAVIWNIVNTSRVSVVFNNTNQPGMYNITYIYANTTDGTLNYTTYTGLNFTVTNLSNCGDITLPDTTYYFTQNITTTGEDCFEVFASNVTIDCQGYTLDGTDSSSNGIYQLNDIGLNRVTIKNCTFKNWNEAVYFYYADNVSVIYNNFIGNEYGIDLETQADDFNISNNYMFNWLDSHTTNVYLYEVSTGKVAYNRMIDSFGYGVFLQGVQDSDIFNNTIQDMGFSGIVFEAGSSPGSQNNRIYNNRISNCSAGLDNYNEADGENNTFYNNFLNNTQNVYMIEEDTMLNNWNTTVKPGIRIYSNGVNIGGNYWTNSTGNGYSDVCDDSNVDGFCDLPYNVTYPNSWSCVKGSTCGNNVDYFPLSNKYPQNSCNYNTGNWTIQCSDGCNITSAINLNNNTLYINGSGEVHFYASVFNISNVVKQGLDTTNRCNIYRINSTFKRGG